MNKFALLVGAICLLVGTILILISGFFGDFIAYNGMYDPVKFLVVNGKVDIVDINDTSTRICNTGGCIYKTNNCNDGIYIGGWCINKDKKLKFGEFQGLFIPNFEYINNVLKIIVRGNSVEVFIYGNPIHNYKVFKSGDKYIFIYKDKDKNDYKYLLLDEYYLRNYIDTNQITVECEDNEVVDLNTPIDDGNFYVLNTEDMYNSLEELRNNFKCNYDVICDSKLKKCYYVKRIDLNH